MCLSETGTYDLAGWVKIILPGFTYRYLRSEGEKKEKKEKKKKNPQIS
jgi:hypothetical protein